MKKVPISIWNYLASINMELVVLMLCVDQHRVGCFASINTDLVVIMLCVG